MYTYNGTLYFVQQTFNNIFITYCIFLTKFNCRD